MTGTPFNEEILYIKTFGESEYYCTYRDNNLIYFESDDKVIINYENSANMSIYCKSSNGNIIDFYFTQTNDKELCLSVRMNNAFNPWCYMESKENPLLEDFNENVLLNNNSTYLFKYRRIEEDSGNNSSLLFNKKSKYIYENYYLTETKILKGEND